MQFIVFIIFYPFILLVSHLPYSILYFISDLLKTLLYKILKYRLKTVRKNISICFPDKEDNELLNIESSFYSNLCDIFVEMIKNISISEQEMKKRFIFKNIELIHSFHNNNRSVVLLCGHYSNWEGMLSIGYHLNYKSFGVYTPLSNKYFDKMFSKSRESHHSFLLSRYKTIKTIKEHYNHKLIALYGFIMDQSPHVRPSSYWKKFMGIKVPVFKGAEIVAKEYNYPVVYAQLNRIKRGVYESEISLISDNPKSTKENFITDSFFNKLENQIKNDPTQYLWTHNRFKYMKKGSGQI